MTHTNHDIRALVEQAEERFAKRYPDLTPSGMGKRATLRSMAFKEVAATLQMDVKTVRQKWRRAGIEPRRVRKGERERFDYLGVEVSESFRRMLGNIAGILKTAQYAVSAVRGQITKLAGNYPHPAPIVGRLLNNLNETHDALKALEPVGICPWCKNVAGLRERCTACFSSGWLPASKQAIVPKLLQQTDVTMADGTHIQTNTDTSKQSSAPEPAPPEEEPLPW
jgi:hypothetical protein